MRHWRGKDRAVVYIYYTQHKDSSGSVLLTELKLTSKPNRWEIAFYDTNEKTIFFLIKEKVLKTPPIALRSYEDKTNVWTYMNEQGPWVLNTAKALTSVLGGITCREVPDLAAIAMQTVFDPDKIIKPMSAEEFFYNPHAQAAGSPGLTIGEITKKLSVLLETSVELDDLEEAELKKLYRRAALKYHPDRNNGDGSQMSELNMLWGLYNA